MIRKAQILDAKKIAQIKIDGWKLAYKELLPDSLISSLNYEGEEIKVRNRIVGNDSEFTSSIIVYEDNNEIKGFAYYGKNISNFPDNYGEIVAMYADVNYLRLGIGRKLIEWTKNKLKSEGFTKMIIWCLKDNLSSVKFYEAMGGNISDERDFEIDGSLYREVGITYKL